MQVYRAGLTIGGPEKVKIRHQAMGLQPLVEAGEPLAIELGLEGLKVRVAAARRNIRSEFPDVFHRLFELGAGLRSFPLCDFGRGALAAGILHELERRLVLAAAITLYGHDSQLLACAFRRLRCTAVSHRVLHVPM